MFSLSYTSDKKLALKQLKTLTWHPAVLLNEHCKIRCQLKLVEGRRKVCIYHEPESFGHACDVSPEAYNFFNVKKLKLSSKGLNIRENEQKGQLCMLELRELAKL